MPGASYWSYMKNCLLILKCYTHACTHTQFPPPIKCKMTVWNLYGETYLGELSIREVMECGVYMKQSELIRTARGRRALSRYTACSPVGRPG